MTLCASTAGDGTAADPIDDGPTTTVPADVIVVADAAVVVIIVGVASENEA